MTDALFRREGALWVPAPDACGPWSAGHMHGGPVFGLIAHAVEAAAPDPELVATRFTFDLSRAVPLEPLEVRTQIVRQSGRLCLIQASVRAADEEFVSATALLLRQGSAEDLQHVPSAPQGPAGIPTESLMRGFSRNPANPRFGFHVRVETRWVPQTNGEPLAIWFRMPLAMVEGETPTALQSAVRLSDFANAVASIAQRDRGAAPVPYINVDATLYFTRRPVGEWFCIQDQAVDLERGVSVATCSLFDERGYCGYVTQARLANRPQRSS